jgi:hypothetical protein
MARASHELEWLPWEGVKAQVREAVGGRREGVKGRRDEGRDGREGRSEKGGWRRE